MTSNKHKTLQQQRKRRVRSKLFGTKSRPRLCVFRSNQHIYAQLINDQTGTTLAAASDQQLPTKSKKNTTKTDRAAQVGQHIAKLALNNKIKTVTFDRGQYKFHGRIKALAQAARQAGLEF